MFHTFEIKLDGISSYLPAMKIQTLVALALTANLAIAPAASPAIGVAVAQGAFDLDAAKVAGNGTLFDGSILETGKSTSEIRLRNGVRVMLDAGTRGKVYRDHMLLEKGTGQLTAGSNYSITARSLRIEGGSAKVSMAGSRVLVAALHGPVLVKNGEGVTLANVAAGRAVELEPRAASNLNTLTGTLEKQAGRYLLTDRTAGITVEVRGGGLDRNAGKNVEVTGTTDKSAKAMAPATQVVYATNVRNHATRNAEDNKEGAAKKDDKRCEDEKKKNGKHDKNDKNDDDCGKAGAIAGAAGAGAGAGAGAAAAGAAGAAAGIGTTTAVVAGVVVAGTVAGTAVALTGDDKKAGESE